MSKIYFAQMTCNRLSEVQKCLGLVREYVDDCIIVDGGSEDDTIIYLRNRGDVDLVIVPWHDNFSDQRNEYIKRVEDNSWVLVSDPDEWFLEETLKNLKMLAEKGDRENKHMFGFQCISVTMKGDVVAHKQLDNYWKGLFFKKFSDTKYINNPHETLVYKGDVGYSMERTPFRYFHIKQEGITWVRGVRNFFINGGGPNLGERQPLWKPFRVMVKEITGIESWDDFNYYLKCGNIDQRIKNWMIEHRKEIGYDGSSEIRENYKSYYRIYHPEEEPEELRGERIE